MQLVIRGIRSEEFDRIRRFSFNADKATWVAMQGYGAGETAANTGAGRGAPVGGRGGEAPTAPIPTGGAPLLLYNLSSAELFNMGLVSEFAFNENGDWLAYTMETPDQVGNAVQLRNMVSNVVRSVESERLLYRHLAWVDSSAAVSVMRGKINDTSRDTVFSIEAFTDFGANGPAKKLKNCMLSTSV